MRPDGLILVHGAASLWALPRFDPLASCLFETFLLGSRLIQQPFSSARHYSRTVGGKMMSRFFYARPLRAGADSFNNKNFKTRIPVAPKDHLKLLVTRCVFVWANVVLTIKTASVGLPIEGGLGRKP